MAEDDTEAQKTALVLATPPRKPGTCVEMSGLGYLQTLGGQASVPSADIRLPLFAYYRSFTPMYRRNWFV